MSFGRPRPHPDPVGPGQESVWDYPRPPRLEAEPRRIVVVLGGAVVADTTRALRVLETSHPPTYYFPPDDVVPGALIASDGPSSFCEWKGRARYWDVAGGGRLAPAAAWSYPEPTPGFAPLADHLAFYAPAMDRCEVGGEVVAPQPGGFYGGWVTSWVVGPFKGEAGTMGW